LHFTDTIHVAFHLFVLQSLCLDVWSHRVTIEDLVLD